MLKIHDIRESRIYQEALEEGVENGIEKGVEKGVEKERLRTLSELVSRKMAADEIAAILNLDIDRVRQEIAKKMTTNGTSPK